MPAATPSAVSPRMSIETLLIFPDLHAPYHDEKALQLVLKAGKALRPDQCIILGDWADFYAVSGHDKDPTRLARLEDEVRSAQECLDRVKALGAKKNVFISGNHEWRLERYLMSKAPELYNIISTPRILELKEKGFHYVPYRQSYSVGNMRFTHDVGPSGLHAATKSMAALGRNVVIGHCHRMEYVVQGTLDGARHVGISLGWLGDTQAAEDYMHLDKMAKDWTLGFGVGYHDTVTGFVTVQPVPILPGAKGETYCAIVGGKRVAI